MPAYAFNSVTEFWPNCDYITACGYLVNTKQTNISFLHIYNQMDKVPSQIMQYYKQINIYISLTLMKVWENKKS